MARRAVPCRDLRRGDGGRITPAPVPGYDDRGLLDAVARRLVRDGSALRRTLPLAARAARWGGCSPTPGASCRSTSTRRQEPACVVVRGGATGRIHRRLVWSSLLVIMVMLLARGWYPSLGIPRCRAISVFACYHTSPRLAGSPVKLVRRQKIASKVGIASRKPSRISPVGPAFSRFQGCCPYSGTPSTDFTGEPTCLTHICTHRWQRAGSCSISLTVGAGSGRL